VVRGIGSGEFAWRERAAAYDAHIDRLREKSMEKIIQQQAEEQASQLDNMRGRYNELMTLAYERAVEWLQEAQRSDLLAQDVLAIIRLHMDYVKAFGAEAEPRDEDYWTEEDGAATADIIREIDELEDSEEDSGGGPKSDDSEEGSEEPA
jgi:hypothetical protein